MWGLIAKAAQGIFTSWVDLKKSKNEADAERYRSEAKAERDWDQEALRQAQYSWKDEFITLIMFSPLVVAWFDSERAMEWIKFVTGLPIWYQIIIAGIVAASFGLRWLFKNKLTNGFKGVARK